VSQSHSDREVASFYDGAVLGLRYLEARRPTGRRFGSEADARWSSFRGDLTTADRLDLLIRDANAEWPQAFGARTVFAERAVAEDEPFGPAFAPLDPVDAEALWRAQIAVPAPADPPAALTAIASAWGLTLALFTPGLIDPSARLILAGPAAIAATVVAFHNGGRDLAWADQVIVVATPPGHRQLAALGGALLGATRPTRLFTASDMPPIAATRGARLVASLDADPADLARARELAA